MFSHRDEGRNPELHAALAAAGIDTAIRNGCIRVSGHLYNSEDEIDRLAGIVSATRP